MTYGNETTPEGGTYILSSNKITKEVIEKWTNAFGLYWAEDKKMPIFVHLISREEVKNFIKVCNKYKNVTFIVAHMIGFSEIARNSKNNNIYFDLSSPEMYPLKTLEKALRMLGSEKLIIGSDTPFGKDNIKKNINRLEKLALSKDEINNITGDNICKILKM